MRCSIRLLILAIALAALISLCSCGGTARPSSPAAQTVTPTPTPLAITLTISPPAASLSSSQSQQFTAAATGSAVTAVTWTVTCALTNCGAITAGGLYTAPALISQSGSVTVTATLQSDPTKSASVTVWHNPVGIGVSPYSAYTVTPGETQTFTAYVYNHTNQDVAWSLSGVGCSGDACGTLSNLTAKSATYTAPAGFAAAATALVTAASVADPSRTHSVKINLMPISSPLEGRYALIFRASDTSTVFAASLVADGHGNLSGVGDLITAAGAQANQPFSGTYTLGPDRRGAMLITGAGVTLSLRLVMVNGNFGRLLDFSGTRDGNGWLEKQNETAFDLPMTAEDFPYALDGVSGNAFTSRVGDVWWDVDGTPGVFDFFWYGYTVNATVDHTTGRVDLPPASPSPPRPHFAFYTVDATRGLMLGDFDAPSLRLSGGMDSWAPNDWRGDYSYYMVTPTGLAAGRFTATPGANQTSAISGVQDDVQNGAVHLDVPVTGSMGEGWFGEPMLSLSIGGVSLGELGFSTSRGTLRFVAGDGSYGEIFAQKDGPFSADMLSGSFGVQLFGRNTHAIGVASLAAPDLTGRLDVSHNGVTPDAALSGTIAFPTADRGNLSLTTSASGTLPFRAYVISPRKVLLISLMAGEVTMGWAEKIE